MCDESRPHGVGLSENRLVKRLGKNSTDGGSTPSPAPTNVAATLTALNQLLSGNVSTIKLGANITGNVTINRSVTIDGQGHTLNGDLTLNNTASNNIVIQSMTVTGLTTIN